MSIWEKAVPFNPNSLVFRKGKYVACLGYVQQDFKEVIQAISSGEFPNQIYESGGEDGILVMKEIGAMRPGDMITSKISLENVLEDGIKALIDDKEKHVKILVEC